MNVKPFTDAFHVLRWQARNCDKCAKCSYEPIEDELGDREVPTCEIQNAVCIAAFDGGRIPLPIAHRMGWKPSVGAMWTCAEVEFIEEEDHMRALGEAIAPRLFGE